MRKHMIEAVLFDLDGVVVFTDKYHYKAWKQLCDEQGWDFDDEVNHGCRGVPRMASLEVILIHNAVTLPEEKKVALATRKNEYYKKLLEQINESDLYPGVFGFLEKLRTRDVRIGLCSSSKNAQTVLDALNLSRLFDAVVTGHDFRNAKPDPEVFLLGAKRVGVHPLHCLVFEDAPSGVQAGLAAGMKVIGVGSADVLPDAPQVIEHYDEIDIDAMLDTGRKKTVTPHPWCVVEEEFNPKRAQYWETLFALTNGFMGLRGAYEEDDPRLAGNSYPGCFLNGIYDYQPYSHVLAFPGYPTRDHRMLNICDWRIIDLTVAGERFSMFDGTVSDYARTLDLRNGRLTRRLTWESPGGRRVAIHTERIVSMACRHSAQIRYEVTPLNFDGEIILESVIKAKALSGVLKDPDHIDVLDMGRDGEVLYALSRPKIADQRVGMAFGHRLTGVEDSAVRREGGMEDTVFHERFTISAKRDQPVTLRKNACFHTSIETPAEEVVHAAIRGVRSDMRDDQPDNRQDAFWDDYWRTADVEIDGNVADQQAIRFTNFHLRQSHPEDDRRSISACGMTGDHYWGHVFWDTEMYIAPHFLYTQPELLRPLLMYRYNILDEARNRAKQMDGVGAMFSWNSISGEECGVVYEASTAEYHLQSAIAYAISRYVGATDDREFLHNYGAEILFETARYLADRGKFIPLRDNKFCINIVCGPDEYGCGVNNNCYTNMLAQCHFRFACRVYDEMQIQCPSQLKQLCRRIGLPDDERELWQCAADNMYIPFNEKLGIHEQDDSFLYRDPVDMSRTPIHVDLRASRHPLNLWRMQVAKQADVVLLMFVLGDQFSRDIKRANYDFYEPRTNHGSSLSTSIHSIVAGEVGYHDEAYRFFRHSALMDLHDFKNNVAGGVHSACLGGTWMAIINGFAGMRDYEDRLLFNPTCPAAWNGYRFKLAYRGRRIGVAVGRDRAVFELIDGDAVVFTSAGTMVTLAPDKPRVEVSRA